MSQYNSKTSDDSTDGVWKRLKDAIDSQIYNVYTTNYKAIFMSRIQIQFRCLNILENISENSGKDPQELIAILENKLFGLKSQMYEKLLFSYFYIAYSYLEWRKESKANKVVLDKSDSANTKDKKIKELEKELDRLTKLVEEMERKVNPREYNTEWDDIQRRAASKSRSDEGRTIFV